ncbi:MAG: Nif3-like dinuclear metal center hexameric protein [Alloprevotella sp.]|nr:Nif3-like dinuclear metal center hexameric protein [Alloprevotella sp.]
MKIKDVAETLERFAPLPLQEGYDNAGLQVGLTAGDDLTGVLLCLDVTEAVLREAVARRCNLVVSHHPLLFRGLKRVGDATMVERCLRMAIREGIAVYSAHTNLDTAAGGVNWEMARRLDGERVRPLVPAPVQPGRGGADGADGSCALFELPEPLEAGAFLRKVKAAFGVERLCTNRHPDSAPERMVRRVALCGGAGDFLLGAALEAGADAFLTGEMHYHQYFGLEEDILIGVLGHYESEQCAVGLLRRILAEAHPGLRLEETEVNTNPIYYL